MKTAMMIRNKKRPPFDIFIIFYNILKSINFYCGRYEFYSYLFLLT